MAQYDGAIRIVTKITTKDAEDSLASLEWQIKKSAKYMDELRSKMDNLKDQKVQTKEFKLLQEELSRAEKTLSDLVKKQTEWEDLGITSGGAWDSLNEEVAVASDSVDLLREKIKSLVDSGKDFMLGKDTEEFANYAKQIKYEEEAIIRAGERYKKIVGKTGENYKKLYGSIRKTFSSIGSMAHKASSGIERVGVVAKKAFSRLNKSGERSNGILATMKSRFQGLALSLLIFNQISRAFTAMTSSIREGFSNIYNESERFRRSVDSLKASSLTLKNAFAAAFLPLVEIAIPYLQRAMDYLASFINMFGQFIAALTGQKMYTRAIKQTTAALRDAEKAAKGYLSPLDEINKYQTGDSGSGSGGGYMFDEAPIENRFLELAKRVRDIFSKIFSPLKKAWENQGKFVMDSWKYALKEIGLLTKSIGKDFLEVWNQPKTISILEDVLIILGDIGISIGNLARGFRMAWEENETGKKILEGIRDIIWAVVANIRHAADVTAEWTKNIDFSPFMMKLQGWIESLIPVFDSLSGIVTDFYEMVLLPLGKWALEDGLPTLLQVLTDFNYKVDWEALRARLAEFWKHLEPFAETVGEGLIIFIERCADALADFINSPAFDSFLSTIENWMDNTDPEDVANALELLAKAIIGLKIAILGFAAVEKAISVFGKIATVFEKLGKVITYLKGIEIVPFLTSLFSAINPGMIGEIGLSLERLLQGTFLDTSTWEGLPQKLNDAVNNVIDSLSETLGAAAARAGAAVLEFLKGVFNWDSTKAVFEEAKQAFEKGGIYILEGIMHGFIGAFSLILEPIIDFFTFFWENICEAFGIHSPAKEMEPLGENIILGLLEGITNILSDIAAWIKEHIFDPFINAFKNLFGIHSPSTVMQQMGVYLMQGLLNGIKSLVNNIKEIWNMMKEQALEIWKNIKEKLAQVIDAIKQNISQKLSNIKSSWSNAWNGMKNVVGSIMNSIKSVVQDTFGWISRQVENIKDKLDSVSRKSSITGTAASRFLSVAGASKYGRSASPLAYPAPALEALQNTPIPRLATGAVIPANKEFLAVLGDQKHGTNVEAPLDTIRQASEEAVLNVLSRLGVNGNIGNSNPQTIIVKMIADGKELTDLVIRNGEVRQMSSGNNPFLLGTT